MTGVLLAGCGSTTTRTVTQHADVPALPFPPRANEPASGPPLERAPAGRIVRVGGRAEGVAVLDGIAAVGVKGGPGGRDGLVLIDIETGRVTRRVPLRSAPRHVQAGGGRFLVPEEDVDKLAFVDPRSGAVEEVAVGDNPHGVTYVDGSAYTGDEFSSTVTEVRGGRRIRSAPVDAQPGGIVPIGGDRLALVSVRAYTIELLDRRTLRGLGSQNVGYGPSHAVATRDGRVWVADTRGDGLSVFATAPRLKFVARVPVAGSPYGLALDEPRGVLWVTRVGRNAVSAVTLGARPRVRRSLATLRQPNTVAVDPRTGRLVIASATDGIVQLLDP